MIESSPDKSPNQEPTTLVRIENLVKHFPKHGGILNRVVARVHAVNGVSFVVRKGESLGVVGESGCGKSTLGKVIVRLHEPTSGQVFFNGQEITKLSSRELRPIRKQIQMIFQDPNSSLNPRMTVGSAIREIAKFHGAVSHPSEMKQFVESLMIKVGLQADAINKYPHEFSGGQKQRIGIARALAVNPQFIIADEPVSALDVSIQAQVLNLMMELKHEFDLTMLFISHDLKVIDHFCDRMLVMYLGNLVEEMPCGDIKEAARHPYTTALFSANPISDPADRRQLTVLEGEVPSPYNPPQGCPFVTRCPIKVDRCEFENPPLVQIGTDHRVACWEVS